MNEQLLLVLCDQQPWRLDDHTREVGRRGLQEAREALRRTAAAERRRSTRRTAA